MSINPFIIQSITLPTYIPDVTREESRIVTKWKRKSADLHKENKVSRGTYDYRTNNLKD